MVGDNWLWVASGRNGTWFIDKYKKDDNSHGTYGHPINVPTRKLAQRLAAELNTAFSEGVAYGGMVVRQNNDRTAKLKTADGTEYQVVDGKLFKRLPFASGWIPAN